jgi:enoyl-CoA hydratase
MWQEQPEDDRMPQTILIDDPAPNIRRITLNRPEKRNALNNVLRGELFDALYAHDADPAVRVTIIRGAGPAFCSGYDLGADLREGRPWRTAGGEGDWARHVVDGWFQIWDLRKPVIAQVHGFCLAGGSELATACDLVYVAEDAQIGYPAIRSMAAPDLQYQAWLLGMRGAMEAMLTGDALSGIEAARLGFANRAFPAERLEAEVLAMAERVAKIPSDLQHLNKRTVHRAMEIMGIRTAIRAGTDLHALGWHQPSSREYMQKMREAARVKDALTARDADFGDYGEGGKTGD